MGTAKDGGHERGGEDRNDPLDRRRFLRLGATAGAAAAATAPSCAAIGTVAGKLLERRPLSTRELGRYLSVMDRGLAKLSTGRLPSAWLPDKARSKLFLDSMAPQDAVVRKSLRSLYFTAMYNHLPEPNRKHPRVQARLAKMSPELDETVFTVTGALNALSDRERQEAQRYLKEHPDTGMEICQVFEGGAKDVGLPFGRRVQMRSMMSGLTWRLQAQPPSLLIDEYVGKIEKVAAQQGQAEQLRRYLVAHGSSAAFWAQQRRMADVATSSNSGSASKSKPAPRSRPRPLEKERPPRQTSGHRIVSTGGVVLGVAAASLLTGGVMLGAGQFAGAFVLTAGAVLLLTGIILLCVGAARKSEA